MTITERKEREREERRMQIISAAEHLFFEYGYDQVSMEQIANEAELSKGTIFFYFKNKEALYFTIVLQGIKLFHQKISDAVHECEGPAISQLTALGMAGIRFSREYPGYRSMILLFKSGRFSLDQRESYNDEVTEFISHSEAMISLTEDIVESGVEDGSIRSDIDPIELAIIVRMMISSVMDKSPEFVWSLKRRDIDEDLLISHYLNLIESIVRGNGSIDV
ncbi:TetR/AcrR family transcriptional regulator [Methanospirillum lacunae]|uniref:TetR/AcrR family transcriptional regulator n=1 Tax=Methanospirillum lacunae TaxID=668570 RepID=A0A2V2MXI1_9EURY|nr:TetR/AcrR family transcriptional regulator [Methanospirillum lacunae]PWR72109.1 TetR/AcrR family transcriptional regulator [Methanospirillum lacunae]